MADRRTTTRQKQTITTRAASCCEYCRSQERYATQPFSAEHSVPRRDGGRTTVENLTLAYQGCNNHKYTKTTATDPLSGVMVPLFHPRRQRWLDHFAWDSTYTVVGLTPTGRATVEALQLNRPGLVNRRRILFAAGEHPPGEPTVASAE